MRAAFRVKMETKEGRASWQGYWRLFFDRDVGGYWRSPHWYPYVHTMARGWLPPFTDSLKAEEDFQGMKGLPGLGLSHLFRWTHQPSWKVGLECSGSSKNTVRVELSSGTDRWLGRNRMSLCDNMPTQQHSAQGDKTSDWNPAVNWNLQSLCDWFKELPLPHFHPWQTLPGWACLTDSFHSSAHSTKL